ncbi:hypothetical protein GT360_17715 [Vibrio astriarenae]|uniref:Negative regulator GrlR n=1 Tax=Vibrio astriarenae TaxID=1481923 RepID=A0A7Z2T725_9VIBR|nr:GrlR family regulatory protein [Vibrio astriarenae]QIA65377.1 hypothetical protein GT360_17715 [Vibrio astriarenae]
MIKDGIYKVTFGCLGQVLGEGIVLIRNGHLNGGDVFYLYQGVIEAHDNRFSAILSLTQHDQRGHSIFGELGDFQLKLSGQRVRNGVFNAVGEVIGLPLPQVDMTVKFIKQLL